MEPTILAAIDAIPQGENFNLNEFNNIMKEHKVLFSVKKFHDYLLYYIKKFEKRTNKYDSNTELIELIIRENNLLTEKYNIDMDYIISNIDSIRQFVNYLYWFSTKTNIYKKKSYLFTCACKLVDGDDQPAFYCGKTESTYTKIRKEIMFILFKIKPIKRHRNKSNSVVKNTTENSQENVVSHSLDEINIANFLCSLQSLYPIS